MNRRRISWILLGALVVPTLGMGQLLDRGQEGLAQPTPTRRPFFRRAPATPAPQEAEPAPQTTPAPTRAPQARSADAEPTRRPAATRPKEASPRESTRAKESAERKETVRKETPKPAATTPKPEVTERDRELSSTIELVREFLQAAQLGQYSKAKRALTPALQKYFDGEHSALGGGLKRVLDAITRDGEIRTIDPEVALRGEGARVDCQITYRDGSTKKWVFDLIKTEQGWKIELDVPSVLQAAGQGAPVVKTSAPAPVPTPAPTAEPQAAAPTPAQTPAPAATPQPALADAPWKKAN